MEEVKNVVFIRDYANYKKCDIVKYDSLPDNIKKMKGNFLSENEKIHEVLEKITNKNNIFFAKVKLVESILKGNKTEIKNPIMLKNIVGAINAKKSISIKVEEDIAINKKGLSVFYLSDGKENYGIVVIAEIAPIKGKAKAMGLKSSFIHNNSLILTTSASKNDNVIEKKIKDNKLVSEKSPKEFDVKEINDIKIELYKENKSALIDNQMHRKGVKSPVVRKDYLDRKDILEKEFFGKTFNDNIHIQLIYNILDIKKIMGLYIDDIIYMFRNFYNDDSSTDLIGTINYKYNLRSQLQHKSQKYRDKAINFQKYFQKIYKYLPYFPYVFDVIIEKVGKKNIKKYDEDKGYTVFRILSMLRQFVKHSDLNSDKKELGLFNIDGSINTEINDLIATIDKKYSNMIDTIEKSFVDNSQKNISLILKALNMDDISDEKLTHLVNLYYDFAFAKENKNLGFSFVRTRELLLEKLMVELNDEDKGKYYATIDFVIYYLLTTCFGNQVTRMINRLKSSLNEEEKATAYNDFTNELLPHFKQYINKELILEIKDKKINNDKETVFTSKNFTTRKSNSYFVKCVYFLTCFLNPKEINMLLTSLINKFENINCLRKILEEPMLGDKAVFTDKYSFFNKLDKIDIIDDLKKVMNVSRMLKKYNKVDNINNVYTNEMYNDVFKLFGFDEKLDCSCDEFKALRKLLEKDANRDNDVRDEKSVLSPNNAKHASLRNFIISSIMNSNNFRYVITYCNPSVCYKVMQNGTVIKFVLNNMPDSQLKKYCQRIDLNYIDKANAVENLSNSLREIEIYKIIKNYDNNSSGIKEIINLYLAVLFIITKQMVQINSYYSIGFSCLERDNSLYEKDMQDSNELSGNYLYLLNKFIEKGKLKPRAVKYMLLNEEEYHELFSDKEKGNSLIAKYRNSIQHLNALSKIGYYINDFNINKEMRSYFELYNYIVQRDLLSELEHEYGQAKPELLNKYINNLNNYHTYDKELMKIMNLPLGYNLARYKNLTIEDIFYDKYKQGIKVD